MASQVPRDPVIGNFKPSRSERAKAKAARDPRADREGDCEKHRAAIKRLPCCIPGCNKVGVDGHHLKQTGERGGAMRSPDKYLVPLCRMPHHDEVERIGSKNELRWFEDRGIDALQLCGDLWAAPRGDSAAMTRIVLAHKASSRKGGS